VFQLDAAVGAHERSLLLFALIACLPAEDRERRAPRGDVLSRQQLEAQQMGSR